MDALCANCVVYLLLILIHAIWEDVDTDLYKLIMSPQYLTTEHIQVSLEVVMNAAEFIFSDITSVKTFLYQMLAGLRFIHSSSVIHRDLVSLTQPEDKQETSIS